LSSKAEIFLDPNTLSEDGTVALSGTAFSEDGKTFAYGLSSSGSDWLEIKFKNVDDGKDYSEILKKVKFSPMTWMHDNKGFFYGVGYTSVFFFEAKLLNADLGIGSQRRKSALHANDELSRDGSRNISAGASMH
jgi:protease II